MESISVKFDKFMDLWYIIGVIKRIYDNLGLFIESGKVLVIYGPRQVGKTTLLRNFLPSINLKYKLDSGDNIRIQEVLSSQDFNQILNYAQGYDLIVIDEAQCIPGIGMGLKIIVDNIPNIKVIATGSSSFELSKQVGEPLTGRKHTLTLYPIAQKELLLQYNKYDLKQRLEEFLIFGSYPEVVNLPTIEKKTLVLRELADSYIFKDILAMERVKGAKFLLDLLKLLAFQIGSQVSLNELSLMLHSDVKTIARYLDLLEKTFIIIRLGGFSKNLRNEITNKCKYYFFDNGIRNAVINQFNPINSRSDIGALWENFIIIERLKKRSYENIYGQQYFWRTYQQKEIDLIEERDNKLFAYECKWSDAKKVNPPQEWLTHYPGSEFLVINSDNYLDFVV